MRTFSANLGFLWSELSLPDAIRAAAANGFAAVEMHWPYDCPVQDQRSALEETGLPLLGLNTHRGDVEGGENGLCAVVGRKADARATIDQAIEHGVTLGTKCVHVMGGNASGPEAHDTFLENLSYACSAALAHDITVLIEPLNAFDAPNYFLRNTAQAIEIIGEVNKPNLKLMFDCYHVGRTEGDVLHWLDQALPHTGHIQFASVPDRGAPDNGVLDYGPVFDRINALGWHSPLGAEYKPNGPTEPTLAWMKVFGS